MDNETKNYFAKNDNSFSTEHSVIRVITADNKIQLLYFPLEVNMRVFQAKIGIYIVLEFVYHLSDIKM